MAKIYVKDYLEEIRKIKEHQEQIDEIIAKLPEASWSQSLKLTTNAMNKKLDSFLSANAELSDEQREAIKAIKHGKLTPEQVSALLASSKNTDGENKETTKPAPKARKTNH